MPASPASPRSRTARKGKRNRSKLTLKGGAIVGSGTARSSGSRGTAASGRALGPAMSTSQPLKAKSLYSSYLATKKSPTKKRGK